jgi:hypothetical protein
LIFIAHYLKAKIQRMVDMVWWHIQFLSSCHQNTKAQNPTKVVRFFATNLPAIAGAYLWQAGAPKH